MRRHCPRLVTCRLVGMTTRENWLGSTTPAWKLTMAPWALLAGEELLAGGLCTICFTNILTLRHN